MFGRTKTEPEPAHTADDDTQAYPTAHRDESEDTRVSGHPTPEQHSHQDAGHATGHLQLAG